MASSMLFLCFSFLLPSPYFVFFFFNDPPTPEISPLSLHDALPISRGHEPVVGRRGPGRHAGGRHLSDLRDHPAAARARRPRDRRDPRRRHEQPCLGGQLARLRSEEHTSELQSQSNLVCRLLLEKKK